MTARVTPRYECQCEYCGHVFFADELQYDCGACRLDDEQCEDYARNLPGKERPIPRASALELAQWVLTNVKEPTP